MSGSCSTVRGTPRRSKPLPEARKTASSTVQALLSNLNHALVSIILAIAKSTQPMKWALTSSTILQEWQRISGVVGGRHKIRTREESSVTNLYTLYHMMLKLRSNVIDYKRKLRNRCLTVPLLTRWMSNLGRPLARQFKRLTKNLNQVVPLFPRLLQIHQEKTMISWYTTTYLYSKKISTSKRLPWCRCILSNSHSISLKTHSDLRRLNGLESKWHSSHSSTKHLSFKVASSSRAWFQKPFRRIMMKLNHNSRISKLVSPFTNLSDRVTNLSQ